MSYTAVLITTKRKIKIINQNQISKHFPNGSVKVAVSRILALPNSDPLWAYFDPRAQVKSKLASDYLNLEVRGPLIFSFSPEAKKNVLETSLRRPSILSETDQNELISNLEVISAFLAQEKEKEEEYSLPFLPEDKPEFVEDDFGKMVEEIEKEMDNPSLRKETSSTSSTSTSSSESSSEPSMPDLESLLKSVDLEKIKAQAPKINKRLTKCVNHKQINKLMRDIGMDKQTVEKFSTMFGK